jgi:hypothetical protein
LALHLRSGIAIESSTSGLSPCRLASGITYAGMPPSTLTGEGNELVGTSTRIVVYGASPKAATACFA